MKPDMSGYRGIKKILRARKVVEGAGVRLHRAIGFDDPYQYDPFLLLDDFRSDNPDDYEKGFPWHPHRGIETITYVLKGRVMHEDSLGNSGEIGEGDVQWMTAGSGIFHQEMPSGSPDGSMHGFQVWANLPAARKMTDPRYRDIRSKEIPEARDGSGAVIKVIAGEYRGTRGPVRDVFISPEYFDVDIGAEKEFVLETKKGNAVVAYVFQGGGLVLDGEGREPGSHEVANRDMVLFDDGERIRLRASGAGMRFLFLSGGPIGESIAWRGPIVMNTEEELGTAYEDLRKGTFVKGRPRTD